MQARGDFIDGHGNIDEIKRRVVALVFVLHFVVGDADARRDERTQLFAREVLAQAILETSHVAELTRDDLAVAFDAEETPVTIDVSLAHRVADFFIGDAKPALTRFERGDLALDQSVEQAARSAELRDADRSAEALLERLGRLPQFADGDRVVAHFGDLRGRREFGGVNSAARRSVKEYERQYEQQGERDEQVTLRVAQAAKTFEHRSWLSLHSRRAVDRICAQSVKERRGRGQLRCGKRGDCHPRAPVCFKMVR